MCEHFVARAAEPFRLDTMWPFAERLERYGMAGFGWGAAWLTADRRLEAHRDIRAARRRFKEAGRIAGRADSEVGARWLEDAWHECPSPAAALRALHSTFGGEANLALIAGDGAVVHYAGNVENPVFSFRLGPIGIVSTALYSIDRSLFQLAALGASERRLVRPGQAIALDATGTAIRA
jgi:hypothetical protein